jgi:hypothetical protein
MQLNQFVIPKSDRVITPTQLKQREKEITSFCKNQMDTIYDRVCGFTKNLDSSKGIAVLGPPGIGKSETVEKALNDSKASWESFKGANLSAIGFYYTLFFNRNPHRIICLDDFDLVYNSQATTILTLLKAATENTYKPRVIKWTKQPTSYMIENKIPNTFEFWGNIIWITNESPETILKTKKLRTHMAPLVGPGGRLSPIVLDWDKEKKYHWTRYLIDQYDILGKNCMKKKGGYSKKIQKMVLDFFHTDYDNLLDITPRFATNIADDILNYPKSWKTKAFQVNSFVWGD